MKQKRVFLPLRMQPICGHSLGPMGMGDLMMGREEGCHVVKIGDTEYVGHIEWGSCSLCNRDAEKRIEKEARALHRKKDSAKTGERK